jgi:hypothetical protein
MGIAEGAEGQAGSGEGIEESGTKSSVLTGAEKSLRETLIRPECSYPQ